MRLGSLFSGYGGLDLAVESVFGASTAWVADIDPGPRKILAHRFLHAPNLGDVTAVDWASVEPVDIIAGGSPCQDVSHAGRRAGFAEGTRSNLWSAMREAIATIRPSLVVWENVRGVMSAAADSAMEPCPGCVGDRDERPVLRAFGRVLGDLAELGYDAQWHGVRAADVGACHGRWRVFVIAHPHDAGLEGWGVRGRSAGERAPGPRGLASVTLLPTPDASVMNDGESPKTWLARRERLKATASNGNGMGTPLAMAVQLMPTPRATDGTKGGPNQRGSSGDLMLPSAVTQLLPTPMVGSTSPAAHGQISGQWHEQMANAINNWGDYAAAVHRHERVLGRLAPSPTEPGRTGNPRLSARFAEWMMALPDGWVTDTPGITRNEALKALGNGVVPIQAEAALRHMLARQEAAA